MPSTPRLFLNQEFHTRNSSEKRSPQKIALVCFHGSMSSSLAAEAERLL